MSKSTDWAFHICDALRSAYDGCAISRCVAADMMMRKVRFKNPDLRQDVYIKFLEVIDGQYIDIAKPETIIRYVSRCIAHMAYRNKDRAIKRKMAESEFDKNYKKKTPSRIILDDIYLQNTTIATLYEEIRNGGSFGSIKRTANKLGISRQTVWVRMRKFRKQNRLTSEQNR